MILAGAIPACCLALLMDFLMSKVETAVTPVSPVSYTHLDVYKRQALHWAGYLPQAGTFFSQARKIFDSSVQCSPYFIITAI